MKNVTEPKENTRKSKDLHKCMTSMEINLEELLRMLSHMCKRSFYQKKTYYCNIFLTSSKKMF